MTAGRGRGILRDMLEQILVLVLVLVAVLIALVYPAIGVWAFRAIMRRLDVLEQGQRREEPPRPLLPAPAPVPAAPVLQEYFGAERGSAPSVEPEPPPRTTRLPRSR